MKLTTYFAASIGFYLLLLGAFGPNTPTEPTPTTTPRPAPTIILTPLTPTQEATRNTALTTTTTTTTTPTALVYPDTPCQQWVDEALDAGWPADRDILDQLLRIIWKESRCLQITPLSPDPEIAAMFNGHDHSLVQANEIHAAWVEEMFGEPFDVAMASPVKALRFAWALYKAREDAGKCGWQPWSVECS